MKLSKSFTLEEFIASQIAERKGIDNTPDETQVENMRVLCENVLEPIRALIQKPIIISSGYRSPELNAAINGSETSQHMEGKAADILCRSIRTDKLFDDILESDIEYDQLIYEGTWVHISYNEDNNRHDVLKAVFSGGKVTYSRYPF